MKFQKRPVRVEATPIEFIIAVGRTEPEIMPDWIQEALAHNKISIHDDLIVVKTLEGNMTGQRSDWLIQGVRGELYPCEGSIFMETYEKVEE